MAGLDGGGFLLRISESQAGEKFICFLELLQLLSGEQDYDLLASPGRVQVSDELQPNVKKIKKVTPSDYRERYNALKSTG